MRAGKCPTPPPYLKGPPLPWIQNPNQPKKRMSLSYLHCPDERHILLLAHAGVHSGHCDLYGRILPLPCRDITEASGGHSRPTSSIVSADIPSGLLPCGGLHALSCGPCHHDSQLVVPDIPQCSPARLTCLHALFASANAAQSLWWVGVGPRITCTWYAVKVGGGTLCNMFLFVWMLGQQ